MKLLDVRWFVGMTNVVIVRTECKFEGIQYFISAVAGETPKDDSDFAMAWGTRFPKDAGDVLFGIIRTE